MSYLHGIKIEEKAPKVIISTGDTSVIALIGTASQGSTEPKLITSLSKGLAEYGPDIEGFSIPSALETLFSYASPKVIVLNILNNTEAKALVVNGKMKRTEGVLDSKIYLPAIPAGYDAKITTALGKLSEVGVTLNIKPNIIITPGYAHHKTVIDGMVSVAAKIGGFAVLDIIAADVTAALAARASGNFNISEDNAILCYPQVKRYNSHEGVDSIIGLSVHMAAAKARRDNESGYHISPSNTPLMGAHALTTPITSSLVDGSADTNMLNGQGVTTVFTKPGGGIRLWGNWTSAFPQDKTPIAMIAPNAVRLAIREALVDASLNYLDKTPTMLAIDMITEDVNAFLRTLKNKGAIYQGVCLYDKGRNTPTEVAQGKLVFTLSISYQSSLELITFVEEVEY